MLTVSVFFNFAWFERLARWAEDREVPGSSPT